MGLIYKEDDSIKKFEEEVDLEYIIQQELVYYSADNYFMKYYLDDEVISKDKLEYLRRNNKIKIINK